MAVWRQWVETDDEPVLFFSGTPGSRLFAPGPEARLITVDRPGYGRSTALAVPTLPAFVEIVRRVAEDAGWKRFPVVGFSGGGPYALACGALLGDLVTSVAVVSSWGPVDELEDAYASLTDEERDALAAIRADPAGASRLLWEHGQWYADDPLRFLGRERDPADARVFRDEAFRDNFAESNIEGARQGQAGLVADWVADGLPWGFELGDIRVPVDLWFGALDPGRAPRDAPEIARCIPSCTLHSCAGEGHFVLIPRWPEIVERALAHG